MSLAGLTQGENRQHAALGAAAALFDLPAAPNEMYIWR
jgi:hypothetical protein